MAVAKASTSSIVRGFPKSRSLLIGNNAYSLTWANAITTSTTFNQPNTFISASDTSGNTYIWSPTSVTGQMALIKLDITGNLVWQYLATWSAITATGGLCVDSSGNVYLGTGLTGSGGAIIAKWNSSGTLQWARSFGTSNINDCNNIAVDSSGNVYVVCNTIGTNYFIVLVKYNSSGTLQWQSSLTASSTYAFCYSLTTDSSGNVYITGLSFITTKSSVIAKWNSSGTLQWQRKLTGTGTGNFTGLDVVVDSSGNSYVAYSISATSGNTWVIAKYNSSGAIQWQKSILSGTISSGRSLAIDSAGTYIYALGTVTSGGNAYQTIVKLDTSGTVQWQNTLNDPAYASTLQRMSIVGSYMYISGYSSNKNIFTFALPTDGSHTGSWTNGGFTYTYASSAFTVATSSFTDAAQTWSAGTVAYTDSSITPTTTTASNTLSRVII
jgi:Beta-propeller repeat